MKYILVSSIGIIDFQEKVNEKLKEGWGLYGGSTQLCTRQAQCMASLMFYQAMIKEND